jgi:hypothetical protein
MTKEKVRPSGFDKIGNDRERQEREQIRAMTVYSVTIDREWDREAVVR